jgi:hypothetical protein
MSAPRPPNFISQANGFVVANNFWGKDDAGVGPMLERMHNAKVTSDELKSFYAGKSYPSQHHCCS